MPFLSELRCAANPFVPLSEPLARSARLWGGHAHTVFWTWSPQQTVAPRWHAVLRQHGTTPAECERLAAAFNYAGFELDPALVLAQQ